MQNYCKTIGALAAASALVAGNAQAEVKYELHGGYSSEYLYRGLNLGQDLVEVGADVKVDVAGIDMSAGVWYGTASESQVGPITLDGDYNMTELDLYADFSKNWGPITTSVGYISRNYDFASNFTANTGEVYFGLSHDFNFMEVSLIYYWGVDGVEFQDYSPGTTDGYTELALRRSFDFSDCLKLNVSTNVGYLMDDREWTAWTSKVSLDWGFAEHAKISPFVAASVGLGEQSDTIWYSTTNQLVGGCMLSVNF